MNATFEITVRELSAAARHFKRCTCCNRVHTASGWSQLKYVGSMVTSDETGKYETEMRNCPCGSTIAVERKVS